MSFLVKIVFSQKTETRHPLANRKRALHDLCKSVLTNRADRLKHAAKLKNARSDPYNRSRHGPK